MIERHTIRWRLNDPAESTNSNRWSRVHIVSFHADDLTRCHARIPYAPYMVDRDDQIPADAPACKRCASVDE